MWLLLRLTACALLEAAVASASAVPLHTLDGVQLAAPPPAPSVSTNPAACCSAGRTCTPFTTYVIDRRTLTGSFTRHPRINCYPHNGAQWATGDLGALNRARCEAACVADRRCDAITVGPAPQRHHHRHHHHHQPISSGSGPSSPGLPAAGTC